MSREVGYREQTLDTPKVIARFAHRQRARLEQLDDHEIDTFGAEARRVLAPGGDVDIGPRDRRPAAVSGTTNAGPGAFGGWLRAQSAFVCGGFRYE